MDFDYKLLNDIAIEAYAYGRSYSVSDYPKPTPFTLNDNLLKLVEDEVRKYLNDKYLKLNNTKKGIIIP